MVRCTIQIQRRALQNLPTLIAAVCSGLFRGELAAMLQARMTTINVLWLAAGLAMIVLGFAEAQGLLIGP
jgi:hypothetical protein